MSDNRKVMSQTTMSDCRFVVLGQLRQRQRETFDVFGICCWGNGKIRWESI